MRAKSQLPMSVRVLARYFGRSPQMISCEEVSDRLPIELKPNYRPQWSVLVVNVLCFSDLGVAALAYQGNSPAGSNGRCADRG
jgi:hypothetical protein